MQITSERQPYTRTGVIFVMTLVCFFVIACDRQVATEEGDKGKVIASVYAYTLYESDLVGVIPEGLTAEDSTRRAENFINSWVREMLLLSKAENNLPPSDAELEKKLRDYRNSLVIYAYETELVHQKLDTIVSDQEIETYYNEHPNDFQLRDNIVKVIYVKIDKKAPNVPKLKNLVKSEKPQDREELDKYCHQFATNYYLDDNSWLLFDDLLKEVPIQTYNRELFLQNNRFVEVADSTHMYFLNIKGFMTRNSQSPLSFEKDNIRNIIINKRKLELIDKMHDDLYKEAVDNNSIKIYPRK
ncbi:MAG TPA: peptidyl-prolyl cis-trans isomerase [Bacteroidia bacterium]|nr:peptidyl-prolyl cis-trans isomerase [Bacteroidia bacterium]